jgi:hypothetical protein
VGIHIQAFNDEWVEYVPDVMDNRVDSEPMTCEIRPMTVRDMRNMQSAYGSRLAGKHASRRAMNLVTKILAERVRNVRNCFVGRPIETGADLAEFGLSEIIDDVFAAVVSMSHLQEGLAKKSDSPSDSSPAETGP